MYDANVYYNPEKFDLIAVAEIDYSSGSYEFDIRVIWRHKNSGIFYTARDSGCSCPAPFEDYENVEALEKFDFAEIEAEVKEELARDYRHVDEQAAGHFLDTLRAALLAPAPAGDYCPPPPPCPPGRGSVTGAGQLC